MKKRIVSNVKRQVLRLLCIILVVSFLALFASCAKGDKPINLGKVKDSVYKSYDVKSVQIPKVETNSTSKVLLATALQDKLYLVVQEYIIQPDQSIISQFYLNAVNNKGAIASQVALAHFASPTETPLKLVANDDLTIGVVTYDVNESNQTMYQYYSYTKDCQFNGLSFALPIAVSDFNVIDIVSDSKGNIYVLEYFEEYKPQVECFSPGGVELNTFDSDKLGTSIVKLNGGIFSLLYDQNKNQIQFYKIDPTSGELKLNSTYSAENVPSQLFNYDDGFAYGNSQGIFCVDTLKNTAKPIFTWDSGKIDYSTIQLSSYYPLGQGVFAVLNESASSSTEDSNVVIVTGSNDEQLDGTHKITIAGIDISTSPLIIEAVNEYNKNNPTSFASIKNYESVQELYLDITTNDMPDIFVGTEELSLRMLSDKGYLYDLSSVIEGDKSFSAKDYIPNLLSLYGAKDGTFIIPTSLSIFGLVGPSSLIGDMKSWTIDDFQKISYTLPTDQKMLAAIDPTMLFHEALLNSIEDYIAGNKCTFQNDSFYSLLEWAKGNGGKVTPNQSLVDEFESVRNNEVAFCTGYASAPSDFARYASVFREPFSFISYPNDSQVGVGGICDLSLGIYANTDNLQDSWNFIKLFLSEKMQSQINYGTPVNIKVFKEQIETAKKNNSDVPDQPILTDAQGDSYYQLITNLSQMTFRYYDIMDIVSEEVAPYFLGDKSKEEVSRIIENRVQLVLDEKDFKS